MRLKMSVITWKHKKIIVYAAFIFCIFLLCVGCSNPVINSELDYSNQASYDSGGYGSLIISADESVAARTIRPGDDLKVQVDSYRIEFSEHSGGQADFVVDPYNAGGTILNIPVGT